MSQFDAKSAESLLRELRPARQECPFVVRDFPGDVALRGYDGGRDAEYVFVERQRPARQAVTIGYAPRVEGTTLIYDLTAETLQGKARPFLCDLSPGSPRVYALLPVQIEEIAIEVASAKRGSLVLVEFRDAQRERLQAALPFRLTMLTADRATLLDEIVCTDRQGRYARTFAADSGLPRDGQVRVRSLLTGREESAG